MNYDSLSAKQQTLYCWCYEKRWNWMLQSHTQSLCIACAGMVKFSVQGWWGCLCRDGEVVCAGMVKLSVQGWWGFTKYKKRSHRTASFPSSEQETKRLDSKRDRQAPRCQLNILHDHTQSHTHTQRSVLCVHRWFMTYSLTACYLQVCAKSVPWLVVVGLQIKLSRDVKDVWKFFCLINQTQTTFVCSIKSASYLSSKLCNHCHRNDTVDIVSS